MEVLTGAHLFSFFFFWPFSKKHVYIDLYEMKGSILTYTHLGHMAKGDLYLTIVSQVEDLASFTNS